MITFQRLGKFWRRNDTAKYQPDIAELRRMFLEARSWLEECRAFQDERLALIKQHPECDHSSILLVHVLPMGQLGGSIDLRTLGSELNQALPPLQHSGWNHRYNADGYMTWTPSGREILSYTQWFRFGGVEGFTSQLIGERDFGSGRPTRLLFARELGDLVGEYVDKALDAQTRLCGLFYPFVVLMALVGLQDVRIPAPNGHYFGHPIDRPELILPPLVIEGPDQARIQLTGILDVIWQSAGYDGAPRQPSR